MEAFSLSVQSVNGHRVVHLAGELDLATAPVLEAALHDVDGHHVVFDCAELQFIDSSGVALVAQAQRKGGATIRKPQPSVRRVLEVMGMDHLCE